MNICKNSINEIQEYASLQPAWLSKAFGFCAMLSLVPFIKLLLL